MSILSIQSAVAYGHVGNTAAVFPLQRLGFQVWPVNTAQLSAHTGHAVWRGRALPPEHVAEVVAGLEALGVLPDCRAVLSGYVGAAGTGAAILDAVARVRRANPAAVYCCDPVMGDEGKGLFVADGIPAFMAEAALPAADIVTPNHFELEMLAGRPVATLEDAVAAARALLGRGPRVAVATSLRRADAPAESAETLAVTAEGAWLVTTPWLPFAGPPCGAGDCLAALFLGHWLGRHETADALAAAVSGVYAVLEATLAQGGELALVAAQEALVAPPRRFAPVAVAV